MNDRILPLFKEEYITQYNFSGTSNLIKLLNRSKFLFNHVNLWEDEKSYIRWENMQKAFLGYTLDKGVFTEKYITDGKELRDKYFKSKGLMHGDLLDIGGGWGLYREWWDKEGIFVVHDPGVQRFLIGPHDLHRQFYQNAFSAPMTFVEGLGECLPYKDASFDTCLNAETLDHCFDPERVLREVHRCLRPAGYLLIIQSCGSINPAQPVSRLKKGFRNPVKAVKSIYRRLNKLLFRPFKTGTFSRSSHLHKFTEPSQIVELLNKVGFSNINYEKLTDKQIIFTASK